MRVPLGRGCHLRSPSNVYTARPDGDAGSHRFFHEEKRHLKSKAEKIGNHALGYRITNTDPDGRYTLTKEVISDPHLCCLLQHTKLSGNEEVLSKLKLYALCAPHLEVGGWGNNAQVIEVGRQKILTAQKGGTWMAIAATIPFTHVSCGYVGQSDGWTDLADNYQLDWQFDRASNGNVALTGELDLQQGYEFTLGLAFGTTVHNAISTLLQSLSIPWTQQQTDYQKQWERTCDDILPLEKFSGDEGQLYHSSYSLLLTNEDKTYPGATIASVSIPWGEIKGDSDRAGYHLVWTRDMVSSVAGLMAAGDNDTALRSLIYLATTQEEDGGFAQNFWIDGEAYWTGIQLDETAFPILLARKLQQENALSNFDIYPMILRAAGYLIRQGLATQEERWEENSGYSPSTLAAMIAALICAACIVREHEDENTAQFIEEYADFLECHIEAWTVTTEVTLVPDIKQHYIRITPADVNSNLPNEDPNNSIINLIPPPANSESSFPAKEIVDGGFLQLVRYGIRAADDPIIVDSVKVIDAVLKTDTPFGPLWHRYSHDGYGQKDDGSPFDGSGTGRGWPLLTGERGHYELQLGNDVIEVCDRKFLAANKGNKWLIIGATVPFKKLSCGYVGHSDGWQDLADNYQMDWEFDRAENGNIGLTGELDLAKTKEFTLGLAFGSSLGNALANLLQSLNTPFEQQQQTYKKQWERTCDERLPLEKQSSDDGNLYHTSVSLLLTHEDKTYSGATIAAMSFPWGEARDGDRYLNNYKSKPLQVWKFHRQVTTVARGDTLRIQTDKAFKLRWTQNEWKTKQDLESTAIASLSLNYVDLQCNEESAIEFTFFWTDSGDWSECNYTVKVV